jgi:hypothetical protein
MEVIFTIAGAVLVLLEVVGALFQKQEILPLGGSHPARMSIVLGLAFVVHELLQVLS